MSTGSTLSVDVVAKENLMERFPAEHPLHGYKRSQTSQYLCDFRYHLIKEIEDVYDQKGSNDPEYKALCRVTNALGKALFEPSPGNPTTRKLEYVKSGAE